MRLTSGIFWFFVLTIWTPPDNQLDDIPIIFQPWDGIIIIILPRNPLALASSSWPMSLPVSWMIWHFSRCEIFQDPDLYLYEIVCWDVLLTFSVFINLLIFMESDLKYLQLWIINCINCSCSCLNLHFWASKSTRKLSKWAAQLYMR